MSFRRSQVTKEPRLSGLLADPVIRVAMACDGVTEEEVKSLVRRVRGNLLVSQPYARQETRRLVAIKREE